MSRYWSKVVQGLTPYVPGEQPKLPNLIKLNTNESPYGPSRRVLDALRAEIGESLRLYPDPASDKLRAAIAQRYGVTPAHVFVGNGSDEVLAHVFLGLLKHDKPVRIGVNWGSLDQELLASLMDENAQRLQPWDAKQVMYQALVQSAHRRLQVMVA